MSSSPTIPFGARLTVVVLFFGWLPARGVFPALGVILFGAITAVVELLRATEVLGNFGPYRRSNPYLTHKVHLGWRCGGGEDGLLELTVDSQASLQHTHQGGLVSKRRFPWRMRPHGIPESLLSRKTLPEPLCGLDECPGLPRFLDKRRDFLVRTPGIQCRRVCPVDGLS
jgi:hypothetical protein